MSQRIRGLTGSLAKDPRVDRMISWTLTTIAAVCLATGAYFLRDMSGSAKELRAVVGELKTEVAVLRTESANIERLEAEVLNLRERVRKLEAK